MIWRKVRGGFLVWLAILPLACQTAPWNQLPSPIKAGYNPVELQDVAAQEEANRLFPATDITQSAMLIRNTLKPANMPPQKNILVISGGGVYGSYCAGALVGWTCSGTRPTFDVVTGISTGALIAPLAFLGPKYDPQIQEFYTTLSDRDLFRIRRSIRTLLTESIADNTRMKNKIAEVVSPQLMVEVAEAHRQGRRLYIGTTELESRRPVIWDMGEIACRGTEEDLELFRSIVLASAAIPGFFPPVRIQVQVDGRTLEERHIDGGVSAALFFRPPYTPPQQGRPLNVQEQKMPLYGSNLYVLVAGKLFADPESVRRLSLLIAANSVSTVIYSQTRGDLGRLYTIALLTGMNFNMSAIPADFPAPTSSTNFDPVEMTKMFNEGYRLAITGQLWRQAPPGIYQEERAFTRGGTVLQHVPLKRPAATFNPSLAPILDPTRPILPNLPTK